MEQLKIRPLSGHIPKGQYFQQVIAPPYDVLTRAQAAEIANQHPFNCLHVTRADAVLPEQTYAYSPHTYRQAKLNYQALLDSGALTKIEASYLIYQIEKGSVIQTGVIALSDNSEAFIKTHEKTRNDKLQDRIHLLKALEAEASPVLTMHRHHDGLASYLERVTQVPPYAEGRLDEGSLHRIWLQPSTPQFEGYLSEIDALYIADGHHRLAASRHCQDRVLTAFFSEKTLNMLAYPRGVHLHSGLSEQAFKERLAPHYDIKPVPTVGALSACDEIGIYFNKQWYHLREQSPKIQDMQQRLATVRLEQFCLAALQVNPETELCFIGGNDAPSEIVRRVDAGELTLGILLAPIDKGLILEMSDKGFHLPAKSTWFDPKVADGLVFL